MCTLHGTIFEQCSHTTITKIDHCAYADKSNWTCRLGNEYRTTKSERVCAKCEMRIQESVERLAFKLEYYTESNYDPTPGPTGVSTPSGDDGNVSDERLNTTPGTTPEAMDCD